MKTELTRWFAKGSWALLDRGLHAGSHFILNVLLARWLSPRHYGVFATGLAAYALLSTLYTAFFTDPLLVFGAGRYQERFAQYLGVLLYGHLGFALAGSATMLLSWLALRQAGQQALPEVFLALALSAPFILLHPLMRQACFARHVPRLAALSEIVYAGLLLGGLFGLHAVGRLSQASAFGIMGAASLGAALSLMIPIRPGSFEKGTAREVVREHWRYGRWLMGASVMQWIPGNLYYVVLPAWIGLEANAAFRALSNLVSPFGHVIGALNVLLVPALVRARQGGRARFEGLVRPALLVFTSLGLVYWVTLSVLDEPLVGWLYRGKYVEEAYLLIILGLSSITGGMSAVLGSAAQALERPNWWFWGSLASTAVMLTAGLGLILLYGLTGAVVAFVLTTVATAGTLAWLYVARRSSMMVEK